MKNIFFAFLLSLLTSFSFAQNNDVEKVPLEKMAMLSSILGEWDTVQYLWQDDEWKQIATSDVTYHSKLKGKLITEEISNLVPDNIFIVETFITYDQYRNLYRLAAVDDTYGLMDIYEGDFISENELQLTNLRAGTNFPSQNDGEMYFRLTFTEIDKNTREFLVEKSSDEGANWEPMTMNKMTRTN
ncbi:DUF1579 family protein [Pseudemcibacter aquimaris]|uniref:DUF1579 family protein n=1 Tax=Pseudemcibacter aquimaris TaxID=2857064 RepID=UPI0020126BD0|nr:DUF1579 family protein [Pseudemcibacter aquimaris]MCC3859741.1 DUF1579 domain-containing protein [Pseudemcibacter aquimaris]WDU60135.1 DUF1579 domain-containing protein [Pseudemcibacter aquimaris]